MTEDCTQPSRSKVEGSLARKIAQKYFGSLPFPAKHLKKKQGEENMDETSIETSTITGDSCNFS